jgi:hypothetical protein
VTAAGRPHLKPGRTYRTRDLRRWGANPARGRALRGEPGLWYRAIMTTQPLVSQAPAALRALADECVLDSLLARLTAHHAAPTLVAHWHQGEFHHDYVLRVPGGTAALGADVLVVSTNCNAGVKEVLAIEDVPTRWALWRARCPDNPEFEGDLPPVLAVARTAHWFDPCGLLTDDARSELRPEARRRQRGGGWIALTSADDEGSS